MKGKSTAELKNKNDEAINILDNIGDSFIVLDKEDRVTFVNKEARKVLGHGLDKMINLNIKDIIPERFGWTFYMHYEKAVKDKIPVILENFRFANKRFEVKFIPSRDDITVLLRDITIKWHVNELYRLALFTLDRLFESVFLVRSDGRLFHVNDETSRVLGYTRDELIHMNIYDIDPGIKVNEWESYFNSIKKTKRKEFSSKLRTKDGMLIPVDVCANYIELYGMEYYCLAARDTTERKRVEDALRISEASLAKSQEMAHIGSWEMDVATCNIKRSAESYRIFGLTPDEFNINYEKFLDFILPEDKDRVTGEIKTSVDTGKAYNIIYRIKRKDGTIRILQSWGETIKDASGRVVKMYGTNQDITEQKLSEQELLKAKAMVEMYNDLLGHDINNMNQIGIGYLEHAIDTLELDENSKDLLKKPLEALTNSSKLIDNIKKLQSVRLGEVRHTTIDINPILIGLKEDFSQSYDRQIIINYDPEPGHMVIANGLLKDVFSNIIGNSIKHSTGTLEINIGVYRYMEDGREYCKVNIEDNGPGIPDEIKNNLFKRFQRGNTKASGKGLGLFLVKTLMEDYGGKVWVEAKVSGDYSKGTRFTVILISAV